MISVIIPSYNRQNTILRAINSVLNQSYDDLEIIVVDDCSTDNTRNIIKKLNSQKVSYYCLDKNSGACAARNFGISKAKGDYIAFLDSDDEWYPYKLEKQMKALVDNGVEVCVSGFIYSNKQDKILAPISKMSSSQVLIDDILNCSLITTGSILCTKDSIKKIGLFDLKLPRFQDWDLAIRLVRNYKTHLIIEPLLILYFQEDSITNNVTTEKKYNALKIIYEKNKDIYEKYYEQKSHILWMIGMNGLCCNKEDSLAYLVNSIKINKLKMKRILIFCLIKLGLKNLIIKKYMENNLKK